MPKNEAAISKPVDPRVAEATALHAAILTAGGYLSLPEPTKSKLAPFIRAIVEYWDGGEGADPADVLKHYPAAKAAFDAIAADAPVTTAVSGTIAEAVEHADDPSASPLEERPPAASTDAVVAGPTEVVLHPQIAVVLVDPVGLVLHPLNANLFASVSMQEQQALDEDVAAHGVTKPLVVAGDGCASPRGTIYAGSRRCAAARKAGLPVPVISREGLSADDEVAAMIQDNLADQHARKLTHKQRYLLEEELRARYGKSQGQRTDLRPTGAPQDNLDGEPAKSSRAPKTVEEVARRAGQRPNAIAQRQIVYGSKVAPQLLQDAVDDGRISISAGADMVRLINKEYGDKLNDGTVVKQAKAKLEAQARNLLEAKGINGNGKSKPKKPGKQTSKAKTPPGHSASTPSANATTSTPAAVKTREVGICMPDFFDAFERAAADTVGFTTALERRIRRDASDRSMAGLKAINDGQDARALLPVVPPDLQKILDLHRIVSKILLPVVNGEVRRTMLELLEALRPHREQLAPESIPTGGNVPS